jgi:hypothetical protein
MTTITTYRLELRPTELDLAHHTRRLAQALSDERLAATLHSMVRTAAPLYALLWMAIGERHRLRQIAKDLFTELLLQLTTRLGLGSPPTAPHEPEPHTPVVAVAATVEPAIVAAVESTATTQSRPRGGTTKRQAAKTGRRRRTQAVAS